MLQNVANKGAADEHMSSIVNVSYICTFVSPKTKNRRDGSISGFLKQIE